MVAYDRERKEGRAKQALELGECPSINNSQGQIVFFESKQTAYLAKNLLLIEVRESGGPSVAHIGLEVGGSILYALLLGLLRNSWGVGLHCECKAVVDGSSRIVAYWYQQDGRRAGVVL